MAIDLNRCVYMWKQTEDGTILELKTVDDLFNKGECFTLDGMSWRVTAKSKQYDPQNKAVFIFEAKESVITLLK